MLVYYKTIQNIIKTFPNLNNITYNHVYRDFNKLADELAGLYKKNKIIK